MAASVGGGLLLGAGIRLGKGRAAVSGHPDSNTAPGTSPCAGEGLPDERVARFIERLEALERKLAPLTGNENVAEQSDLRPGASDLQIQAMEARLRQDLSCRQAEQAEALAAEVQKKVTERIALIEAEVSNQRAAVGELRECSMRTEQTLQKVLEGIGRLVESQTFPRSAAHRQEGIHHE
jgi:alanyl-tRNA synthetase